MTTTRAFVISLMFLTITLSPEVLGQTFDMPLPARSTAACDGPLCALLNPAGLSFADDGAFLFVHAEGWSVDGKPASRADALLATAYGMGIALQFVQPDVDTAEGSADYLKLDLVLPLFQHRRTLSVAAGLSILDPTETDETPSVDIKLSAMLRLSRHLSLGLVGRQLTAAGIHGVSAHRSLDMGLAIRPLWFAPERLTLALDAALVEGGDDPPLRFTALARPFNGLALVATANLDGAFGVGLSIDFLRAQVGGYTWFDDQANNQGMLLTAGASLAMGPGMVLREQRSAEIVLDAHWSPAVRASTSWLDKKNNLLETVLAIRQAAEDNRVDSLIIRIEDVNLPFHAAQELRQAIAAFRLAGKKVAFHLEAATSNSYYLACAGDAIYLNPAGAFHVTGRSFQATFLRGALDLIGIRAEAHRMGDYKSAVESLTHDRPSSAYLEVLNSLADEASSELFTAIAQGRGLPLQRVRDFIDSGVLLPRQALEADLIDGVAHEDEVDILVAEAFGHPAHRIRDYSKQRRIDLSWSNHPTIAIVHATGSIARQPGLTGGMRVRDLVETLQDLQRDKSVAAVVLQVDSPGGSILASELIRREVDNLTQVKPVVVSMASVAASGGYYIACSADWIVANPSTITGSIGVFSLLFDASELMERLGIHREVVKRGELADLFSFHRSRNPDEHALLQEMVDGYYQDFLDRVAEGRQMTREQVHAIAQGRVWTGKQAKERGLVDELGGLDRAVQVAKQRAALANETVRLLHLPKRKFSLPRLLESLLGGKAQKEGLLDTLDAHLARLRLLASLAEEPAVALLPWIWMD